MNKVSIDCDTGVEVVSEMTPEEVTARQQAETAYLAGVAAEAAAAAARAQREADIEEMLAQYRAKKSTESMTGKKPA